MTTPGVEVESTADTPVRSAHPPMLVRVTLSELHSLRSMMPLPLPPVTAADLTEGQSVWLNASPRPAIFESAFRNELFGRDAMPGSGVPASPCFVRLVGVNKTARAEVAVMNSARVKLRFMGASFSLVPVSYGGPNR